MVQPETMHRNRIQIRISSSRESRRPIQPISLAISVLPSNYLI